MRSRMAKEVECGCSKSMESLEQAHQSRTDDFHVLSRHKTLCYFAFAIPDSEASDMSFGTLAIVPGDETRIGTPFDISSESILIERLPMQLPRARIAEYEEVSVIHPVLEFNIVPYLLTRTQ